MTEIDPGELARALNRLAAWADEQAESAPREDPLVRRRLAEHLGADPGGLPVVSAPLAGYQVAAEGGDAQSVGAAELDRALTELRESGDELTGRLLGGPDGQG
jgi:hypothetical protein